MKTKYSDAWTEDYKRRRLDLLAEYVQLVKDGVQGPGAELGRRRGITRAWVSKQLQQARAIVETDPALWQKVRRAAARAAARKAQR